MRNLRISILEIDNDIKHGGHDGQYKFLNLNEIEMECNNCKLLTKRGKEALCAILRAYNIKKTQDKYSFQSSILWSEVEKRQLAS